MTKDQQAKILEIVKNDCFCRGQYFNFKGETCVIGGLIKASGFERERVSLHAVENQPELCYHLELIYGISPVLAAKMQELNDDTYGLEDRRRVIVELIQSQTLSDAPASQTAATPASSSNGTEKPAKQ